MEHYILGAKAWDIGKFINAFENYYISKLISQVFLKNYKIRLGHGGSEDHVRFPKMIEALLGKRIAHIAPGLSNMVIVTEDHQMIAWGVNDYGQFGKSRIPHLRLLFFE